MNKTPVATPRETVAALLTSANRAAGHVPIRRTFVQKGTRGRPEPGVLATLVRNGDRRALDLYLLLRAVVSARPWESHRGAGVWARALRVTGVPADEASISKIWARLAGLNLIARSKHGRLANITVLCEDGSGDPFVPPWEAGDPYLQLPVAYWMDEEEEWSATLSLPAKAMLLIALSLKPGFPLPVEKAPEWYGASADTAQRGLAELCGRGVLRRARKAKKAPLAPQGFTYDTHYTLLGDFARPRSRPNKKENARGD